FCGASAPSNSSLLLDNTFRPAAVTPYTIKGKVVQTGVLASNRILTQDPSNTGSFYTLRLEPQGGYLFYRYRRMLGTFLIVPILLFLTSLAVHRSRQRTSLDRALASESAAVMRYVVPSGRVVADNHAARSLLGDRSLSQKQLVAHWPELVATLTRNSENAAWQQSFKIRSAGGGDDVVDITILPDDARYGFSKARIIRVSPTQPANGSDHDDSWRKLARRVVHDIRTPLSSIRLAAHRLKTIASEPNSEEASEDTTRYIGRIVAQIDTIDRQTSGFLRAIDKDPVTYEAIDPAQMLADVDASIRSSLPADVALRLDVENGLPLVVVDRKELRSVVEEIIHNAVNAMSDGGTVTLQARIVATDEAGPRQSGKYVAIEILDTGHGMSSETLAQIFESGFTTRPDGTGLGMTIARRVIENYGGQLTVSSEEGVGTIVAISLPGMG
ncbi:MAG: ATP-binding protein, partial [Rhodothermales bacterium]